MLTNNYYKALAMFLSAGAVLPAVKNYSGSDKTISKSYPADEVQFGANAVKQSYVPNMANLVTSTAGTGGAIIGTGTTPPTVDDYCLSGDIISGFVYSVAHTATNDSGGVTFKSIFTITNTGSEAFTIGEVGLIGACAGGTSTTASYKALFDRTVLDEPITIEAGGIGKLTYTIRLPYPTA